MKRLMSIPPQVHGKNKNKFYKSVGILYDSKCWAVDKKIEKWMSVAELRIFRYLGGWLEWLMTEDTIRNVYMRSRIAMASIVDKMRKNKMRWYHVTKTEQPGAEIMVIKINIGGKRKTEKDVCWMWLKMKRGRPVYVRMKWEIVSSGSLERWLPTANSWDNAEGNEDNYYT